MGPLGSQMIGLGCHDSDWVGGNDRGALDAILPPEGHIQATYRPHTGHIQAIHFECGQGEMWLTWEHFWLVLGLEWGS